MQFILAVNVIILLFITEGCATPVKIEVSLKKYLNAALYLKTKGLYSMYTDFKILITLR